MLLKNTIPILLLLFSVTLTAQNGLSLTLDEAVQYAYDNNLTIRNAQIAIADAEQQILERRAVGLPQVNGEVGFNRYLQLPVQILPDLFVDGARDPVTGELPEGFSREVSFVLRNSFTAGATLSGLIYDGSYNVAVKAARRFREYVRQDLEVRKRSVRDQVMDAYLPSLLLVESLNTLDKNITNLEKLFFETQQLYKEGFVEQLDVDRLELSIANLKTERDNLVRQQEVAANALKLAMGFPIEKPLTVTDNIDAILVSATGEELTSDIDYTLRPQYNLINKGLELNQLNIDVNRAGYLPSLSGFLSYQQQWLGDNFNDGFWVPNSVVGLQLNVPIFDGFAKKSKIERARLDMETVQNQKRDYERLVNFEVANARTQYLSAQERLKNQRRNLELARRIYNTSEIKYREGVGSSVELTQAEQSLFETQQNLIQAKYDLLSAKIKLDQALGK
ncbi:MAG: TolC family protein [Saprospiraceae bacterium]